MLADFEREVSEVVLIPSSGGVFEVMVGDELAFSKKETGHHAEFDDILAEVRKVRAKAETQA